jgi:3-deoxy-7-phosphoheptulonate synthase
MGAQDWQKAEEALKWLHDAGKQFEMPVVTEVRGENQVEFNNLVIPVNSNN